MIQRELNSVSFYGCSNYVSKGDRKGILREINGSMKMVCLASVKANVKENSFFLGCKKYLKCKWTASVDSQDPKYPKCNGLMKRKKNFKSNEFFTATSLTLNAMEFCLYTNSEKKGN
ncbi:cag pathogenicity island protein [Helicobacter pylori]|uniref:cag pathogenicity island protein n=1 Tax=Helicobacter pylori TaxID=210 RepID=UPI0009A2E24C|nr:cag pathogenicity island protein [Helicobacter pylori]NHA57417.1 cag pathogenicity island protein [Helicobacter pylori]NHA65799.1 cag pathogenicity island protein [Helicobacter pylori]OPG31841.1 cag pathogenicity island protein [Helicobacter pylori]